MPDLATRGDQIRKVEVALISLEKHLEECQDLQSNDDDAVAENWAVFFEKLDLVAVEILKYFDIFTDGRLKFKFSTNGEPATRRYHTAVLDALMKESSPLYYALGWGRNYDFIKKAKRVRN